VSDDVRLHTVWDVVAGTRVRGRANDRALAREEGVQHAVLVHGLGMATDYLEPTMRALGDTMAVSALDLPGFGGSRRLGADPSTALGMTAGVVIPSERSESRDLHSARTPLSELADALIEWLGVRRIVAPVLVGQSHGCQVIVEAMTRVPELASALVLNAPTMLAEHRSIGGQLWRVILDAPREPLSLVPHVVRDYLVAGPVRILATLKDALRDRIEDKLPAVRVPVSIVTGARDPVSPPAWGERLARLVGARFTVVPGAAHAVPFSHPEALAAEIVAMARRVEASRASR
jgi:pimeloyl-ACP methyl ester carboxylesterase